MAILMGAPKSQLSFDVFLKKKNGKLWFYLRKDSHLLQPMVHEGVANVYIKDQNMEKWLQNMSVEANLMSRSFVEQILEKKEINFSQDEQHSSEVYVYRSWHLANYTIFARCAFDGLNKKGQRVKICAATQHNPRYFKQPPWQRYLYQKFGTIKTADVKQNMFRYVRWAIEANLAECNQIMLGWICREFDTNTNTHHILKVQSFKMKEFAEKVCYIFPENFWEVFNFMVTQLLKDENEDGKYVILRDANKPKICVYKVGEEFESGEDTKSSY